MTRHRRFQWMLRLITAGCAALMMLGTNVAGATPTVALSDWAFQSVGGSSTISATYTIDGSGDTEATPNPVESCSGCTSDVGDWLSPKSGMSNYEVRAFHNCPSDPGRWGTWGQFGTWMTAGVGTGWGVYINEINNSVVCSMEIQIREKTNPSVILDTATVSFNIWTGA